MGPGSSLDDVIKYYEEDSWKRFIEKIANLCRVAEGVIRLYNELRKLVGQTLYDVINKYGNVYEKILLGGITQEGTSTERSLAKFYEIIFGIGVDDPDIIIRLQEDGVSYENALKEVKVIETDSKVPDEILNYLEEIYNLARQILQTLEKKSEAKVYKINSPTIGVEAHRDLLNALLEILPQYEPLSFFIISLYSVPRFYLERHYPKLFSEDVQELLKSYGVHLHVILEPNHMPKQERENWAIIGLDRNCVAWLIRELIMWAFKLIRETHSIYSKYYTGIEDEFKKYWWSQLDKLRAIRIPSDMQWYCGKRGYKIDTLGNGEGEIVGELSVWYFRDELQVDPKKGLLAGYQVVSYAKLFALLAPAMFLGLGYCIRKSADKVIVGGVCYWER